MNSNGRVRIDGVKFGFYCIKLFFYLLADFERYIEAAWRTIVADTRYLVLWTTKSVYRGA